MNCEDTIMAEFPLERDEFVKALHAQRDRYWREHPFHTRLHQGKLSDREIRCWVANRWYYQAALPRKDAAILANCPLPEVRRRWISRIVYQDGISEGEGGLEAWLCLAEAVGLGREEVISERHVAPGVRFATDAYLTFARERPWIEAVAASLTELFSPDLMRDRVVAMRRQYPWIDPAGYAYFESRTSAAVSDAEVGLDLVLSHCRTRAAQNAAQDALAFKCDVLWALLDGIEHATTDQAWDPAWMAPSASR
jgi:pyrroloquinoline-quinone synthase